MGIFTNEKQVVQIIRDLIEESESAVEEIGISKRIQTFGEANLLTRDQGLVITLEDGYKLYLTVNIQKVEK